MKILLCTPLPRLANELCDVLRLFAPLEAFAVQATAPLNARDAAKAQFTAATPTPDMEPLRHTFTEVSGLWRCTFTLRGRKAERTLPIPADAGAGDSAVSDETAAETLAETPEALLRRRLQKRLCKLTLYDLCKELTGHRPPWGSLTGIRPTRLVYEGLARGLTLAQSTQALTDVFDVSPDRAALLGRIVAVQQTLPAPRADEADVYVSIPFCRTRCAYCSFPGEALGRGQRVTPYLDALLWEMEQTASLMATRGLRLRALYIGGGTPTALPPEAFARLLHHTALCFAAPREFTVEAGRPDTITPAHLRTLREHGVTRISVNPQTMNDDTLKRIGRDHTAAQTEEAFALARAHGFTHINMDVIAGLPGETPADFDRTLARVRALGPDSLTVHTLAIKRSSRLHLEGATLPDAAAVAAMVEAGEAAAAALGLEPYYLYRQKYMAGQQQNVGYARPGFACLYNVDIMEENTSILACGAGAISKRVFADRELRIERAPNVSDVDTYLARVAEMAARKQALFA
ncbi:MAG: coproporphyrinogen dehydrogenase HemZ [Candidatus Limiplasma sp.]|nr:coproporphyrinogen dehydrogenase HemZ [Candidatus Limiplasma sp.]